LNRRAALSALVLILLLPAGCSPFAAKPAPESDEPGGVHPKPVTYTDDKYHYSIDSPGPLTAGSQGGASYFGPEERLEVLVVEGASAADAAALADKDVSALKSTISDFKLMAAPATVTLGDQRVVKFTYTGTVANPKTGRPTKLTSARYYIARNSLLLAVVTYGDKSEEFDPKEADAIARSFRWL
jgi:hypothetical protein